MCLCDVMCLRGVRFIYVLCVTGMSYKSEALTHTNNNTKHITIHIFLPIPPPGVSILYPPKKTKMSTIA
jgi:hypothetical protein